MGAEWGSERGSERPGLSQATGGWNLVLAPLEGWGTPPRRSGALWLSRSCSCLGTPAVGRGLSVPSSRSPEPAAAARSPQLQQQPSMWLLRPRPNPHHFPHSWKAGVPHRGIPPPPGLAEARQGRQIEPRDPASERPRGHLRSGLLVAKALWCHPTVAPTPERRG